MEQSNTTRESIIEMAKKISESKRGVMVVGMPSRRSKSLFHSTLMKEILEKSSEEEKAIILTPCRVIEDDFSIQQVVRERTELDLTEVSRLQDYPDGKESRRERRKLERQLKKKRWKNYLKKF